jgi:hypothetical protein
MVDPTGCASLRPGRVAVGDAIALVALGTAAEPVLEEALAVWRECPNAAQDFPRLVAAARGVTPEAAAPGATSVLEVRLDGRNSGSDRCGSFRGRTITLFASALTSAGEWRSCGSQALNLAHELGHALGLADSVEAPRCDGTIMAGLSSRNAHRRAVSDEECRLAGTRWLTFAEWRPESPARPALAAPASILRTGVGALFDPL